MPSTFSLQSTLLPDGLRGRTHGLASSIGSNGAGNDSAYDRQEQQKQQRQQRQQQLRHGKQQRLHLRSVTGKQTRAYVQQQQKQQQGKFNWPVLARPTCRS